jgi:hypothetical protein
MMCVCMYVCVCIAMRILRWQRKKPFYVFLWYYVFYLLIWPFCLFDPFLFWFFIPPKSTSHHHLWSCMHVCVCMYACVCMHACMCVCVCVYACKCMCGCMYMHVSACVHVCICMYVHVSACAWMHRCMNECMHACLAWQAWLDPTQRNIILYLSVGEWIGIHSPALLATRYRTNKRPGLHRFVHTCMSPSGSSSFVSSICSVCICLSICMSFHLLSLVLLCLSSLTKRLMTLLSRWHRSNRRINQTHEQTHDPPPPHYHHHHDDDDDDDHHLVS